jgi:nitrite reductase (NO-forming)
VLGLSQHFAATLARGQEGATTPLVLAFALGAVGVLTGVADDRRWLLVAGASLAAGVVVLAWLRLRRARAGAVGARFGWIVRMYERAHGAFLHGALLGALLGAGLVSGPWYLPTRIAHLHANVLGWGGLTLLATLVFFGPTVLRRQIEAGADERAARHLRRGATGLTVALFALLATAAGGAAGTVARLVAAGGLGVLAHAATTTCAPILRTALRGSPSPGRWPIAAVCTWLPAALWLDVLVVATGAWAWLDALGVVALTGVLLQAVLAAALHLVPIAFARDRVERDRLRAGVARGTVARTVLFDFGVVLVVTAAALRPVLDDPATVTLPGRTGWALVALAMATLPVGLLSARG